MSPGNSLLNVTENKCQLRNGVADSCSLSTEFDLCSFETVSNTDVLHFIMKTLKQQLTFTIAHHPKREGEKVQRIILVAVGCSCNYVYDRQKQSSEVRSMYSRCLVATHWGKLQ